MASLDKPKSLPDLSDSEIETDSKVEEGNKELKNKGKTIPKSAAELKTAEINNTSKELDEAKLKQIEEQIIMPPVDTHRSHKSSKSNETKKPILNKAILDKYVAPKSDVKYLKYRSDDSFQEKELRKKGHEVFDSLKYNLRSMANKRGDTAGEVTKNVAKSFGNAISWIAGTLLYPITPGPTLGVKPAFGRSKLYGELVESFCPIGTSFVMPNHRGGEYQWEIEFPSEEEAKRFHIVEETNKLLRIAGGLRNHEYKIQNGKFIIPASKLHYLKIK